MRLIPSWLAASGARRNYSPHVALIVTALVAATMTFTLRMDDGQTRLTPQPHPDCVEVIDTSGTANWYCGRTIQVPRGARVYAPNIPPCLSDDGSGPLPCRWDATIQGHIGRDGKLHGTSFTVLPDGTPMNGWQRVIFRYDTGSTVVATVPAS